MALSEIGITPFG